MKSILVAKMEKDARLPTRNNKQDAGLDLYAYFDTILQKGETRVIRTGCAILVPVGYVGLIMPKGRSDYLIGSGVVDAGYTGEIKVKVINITGRTVALAYGDAIAQLVVVSVVTPEIDHVSKYALQRTGSEMSKREGSGGINKPWDGRRGW